MGKLVECAQVDPSAGCKAVIRGKDEAEVLRNATVHAREHGLRQMTPELESKLRSAIRDE